MNTVLTRFSWCVSIEILREKQLVYENENVSMECPKGNSSQQLWIKQTQEDGDVVGQESCAAGPKYHKNSIQVTDEGMYECHEGKAVLLVVELEVNG